MKYESLSFVPFLVVSYVPPDSSTHSVWRCQQGPTVLSKDDIERVFALYDRVSFVSYIVPSFYDKSFREEMLSHRVSQLYCLPSR